MLSAHLCQGALVPVKRFSTTYGLEGMEVYQVNQMVVVDMERRVRQTASTMTALQAVTQAVFGGDQ